MNLSPSAGTSVSLLDRLRHESVDQEAWSEFVRRYGPHIYRWCRKWKLQEADAQDVTQAVLLRLADKMRTFQYDPSRKFRAFLKTLTHNAWYDFLQSRKRAGVGSGDTDVLEALHTLEARDDLVQHLQGQFDREVLDEAMTRVQKRVEPHTWKAFCLTALEGLAGSVAAERLNMKIATVFKAKSKVQKLLQEEVANMEG